MCVFARRVGILRYAPEAHAALSASAATAIGPRREGPQSDQERPQFGWESKTGVAQVSTYCAVLLAARRQEVRRCWRSDGTVSHTCRPACVTNFTHRVDQSGYHSCRQLEL